MQKCGPAAAAAAAAAKPRAASPLAGRSSPLAAALAIRGSMARQLQAVRRGAAACPGSLALVSASGVHSRAAAAPNTPRACRSTDVGGEGGKGLFGGAACTKPPRRGTKKTTGFDFWACRFRCSTGFEREEWAQRRPPARQGPATGDTEQAQRQCSLPGLGRYSHV